MPTKEEIINSFDPNNVGAWGNLFGLPFELEHAELIIIPVTWEVTVSYGEGTAMAPEDILYASSQIDLFDADIEDAWKMGIAMLELPEKWLDASNTLRQEAETYIGWLETEKQSIDDADIPYLKEIPDIINRESEKLNAWVKSTAEAWLNQNKMVVVLGGDHSTPLGLLEALAERYSNFGILQIDAHADLREAYEGFKYSHASIMYNALQIPQISKLVQVGIRDFCEEEYHYIHNAQGRVSTFWDTKIKEQLYEGASWGGICNQIIAQLPDNVYISFDIDGLDPKLCPHTGTPVAGGFDFEQIMYLIKKLVKAGKKIIGFDLVEVSSGSLEDNEWDANVGARVLYKLCNWMGVSQGKLKMN